MSLVPTVSHHVAGGSNDVVLSSQEVVCGPENASLRHILDGLADSFASKDFDFESPWLPLVLYGEAGCGKSHIARCLAANWSEQVPDRKTIVITAADLARSLKRTELADDIDRFTSQQRNASLLVIDDLHQLAKKTAADAWLSHLLDHRNRYQQPTIITCKGLIANQTLSNRLRSRLNAGLCIPLVLPSAVTRETIVRAAVKHFELSFSDEEIDQLVTLTTGKDVQSIRAYVAGSRTNRSNKLIQSNHLERAGSDFIDRLMKTTARQFGVRLNDLKGPSRRKNTVLARAVAMFLLRELTTLSLADVGLLFRNRDHTTVRHACKKIRRLLAEDVADARIAIASICGTLDVEVPSCRFPVADEKCA